VQDALWLKRVRDAEAKQLPAEGTSGKVAIAELSSEEMQELLPSEEELDNELETLRLRARLERLKLESFLEFINPSGSFVELRREKRQDQEVTGNAFWEVLRDKRGRVSRFVQVPPNNVRMTPQDKEPVKVTDKVQVGLEFEEVAQHRFFRRFAQKTSDTYLVWFKEFGDPRVVSRETGKIYADMAAFTAANEGKRIEDQPATEMLHFRVSRPGEPHGVPRWIGAFLAILGTRASEEVNYYFFDNKGVPPLAILVSGGRLDDDSVETIKSYVRDHLKGRENFHKILIIQADQDPLSGENPHLKFEKLADVQQGDSLFQNYEKANGIKVGAVFRLPRIVRGESEDVNRATALVAFKIVDEQVFEPERRAFDSWFNRVVLPELGITMWRFKSLGPQTRDPEKVAEIIVNLVKVGVLVPNEAREFASDILGLDLDHLEAPWAKQPLQLTLAGFPANGSENDEDLAEMDRLARDASNNSQRREALREAVEQADRAAVLHSESLIEGELEDGDHQAASA
jgi:PBSX family phage portal protein